MILSYEGRTPRIAPTAFIAPTATIIGDVTIGEDASVWFGAVLRGDVGHIEVGPRANIQDNAVLHSTDRVPTVIGDGVTIGHGAILEGCTVERGALVGMNAVVLHEAIVGEESLIAAGSVVTDRTQIPPRTVAAGAPCRVRKPLSGPSADWIAGAARAYVGLSRRYLEARAHADRPPGTPEGPVSG
ncbi:MAG TPA: gamma carbonic anhydrase family protein [bacterium]|nr:gamma carbonic anhydrase family protein [bacterium]